MDHDGVTSSDTIALLERKVATLTRLMEANTVLNSALLSANVRLETLLSYLMDTAAEITGCEGASVLLWNNNTHQLVFVATTNNNATAKALLGKPVPLDSIAGTIVQERRTVQVDDVLRDPRHYRQLDSEIEFVTRSLLGVPMIAKGKVIGVLEVVNKKQLPWDSDDALNLTRLADEAAVAIDVAQLVMALQKANTELNELDKLKSDFIAIASHELRTPLGVIMGYASFLQEETDPGVALHASKVMESALKLRRIIEDMINLRYLKQSPSELNREVITMGELLDDLKRDMKTLCDTTKHIVEIHCVEPEVKIDADRSRIVMAIINVINNAVAFTPHGGKIIIHTHTPNTYEGWIAVTDTGVGIAADQLERIFEEFYQIEDHMTRRHGGLGIGLSITRALVKAHGGRVWASSAGLGQGATFTLTLPLAKA